MEALLIDRQLIIDISFVDTISIQVKASYFREDENQNSTEMKGMCVCIGYMASWYGLF